MCMPKPPKDNSAKIAREQEAARQTRITQGQGNIDQNFSQFNDPYFAGLSNDYSSYYTPQLEKQYSDANQNLTYKLARSGNAESSTANKQFGDLLEAYNTQRRSVADNALAAGNSARSNVENQKASLYSLNSSSADPSLVASRAAAAATGLRQPQTFSPLGNLFAGFINSSANSAALNNQAGGFNNNDDLPGYNWNSSGSGRTVN